VIHCGHEPVATPERAAPPCRRWIASPFGGLCGFLCVTSAPVRGWVIEAGHWPGKIRRAPRRGLHPHRPSAPWSRLSCSWELLRIAIPQINRELRTVAELSHSSYRAKTCILLSASQPFWTSLRSTPARRLAVEGPFGTMGIELQNPVPLAFCVSGWHRCVRQSANARTYRDYSGDRKNRKNAAVSRGFVAGGPGFEPRLTESDGVFGRSACPSWG
jgi:hypothetical protein